MHSHPAYVAYVIKPYKAKLRVAGGAEVNVDRKPGDAFWGEPVTHSVENRGDTDIHNLIVELKSEGTGRGKPVVKRTNPPSLSKPTGYTHVVEVTGGRTIYIAGQLALDQTGATFDDVVKITVFMTDASDLGPFREVRDRYFTGAPPASTLVQVVRLARPDR